MSLASLLLFALILAYLFADVLLAGLAWGMRAVGLLPPPVVRLDGLLVELFALWPLEEDEGSEAIGLTEERAALERLLRAA